MIFYYLYKDWHTYSVEWDADKITWYIDGKTLRTTANRDLDSFGNRIVDPIKIILSAHVQPEKVLNDEPFEEFMHVDYVKVYRLKYDCGTPIVGIPDFSTFDYKVKKSIKLNSPMYWTGRTAATKTVFLRATDFIELQAGFEAPLGVELYLDINPCDE